MAKNPHIPEKLPVKVDYQDLLTQITKAHGSLARLDAMIGQLPNPSLLERTFLTKEAVLSSQIEGTQATIKEVFEYEAEGQKKDDSNKGRDIQEITNYRMAMRKGVEMLKERPLSENLIKELHKILLQSVRGYNKAPGEFRKQQVYIGKPGVGIDEASYVPPPPTAISELFSNFEQYLNSKDEQDVLVQIAIAHFQFEAIHPFLDGNGRIGRLLIPLFLYDRKILSYPLLYLSQYFEENRPDYYQLLNNITAKGEWLPWIKFFLHALEEQSTKAQETSKNVLSLYKSYKEKIVSINSKYALSLLDAIFAHPVFSYKSIKDQVAIKNPQTLITLIKKFVEAGIVQESEPERKRNKLYAFGELMKLLNQ
ncbi:MAG: Fic family protein [Patescibacteria group bacterium]|nr:Fic family protein [Patescibacteria group bacterium]MDE2438706.1 Fic family protein [Patescibacteria group bacterium]